VSGWDVDAGELRETARRIVLAKRAFNIREGWTRADDTLPERLLSESVEVASGREAVLTKDLLNRMIDRYYQARGLDAEGLLQPSERVLFEALAGASGL
jgi:aldehyde:ferredoxin oxidoreductase